MLNIIIFCFIVFLFLDIKLLLKNKDISVIDNTSSLTVLQFKWHVCALYTLHAFYECNENIRMSSSRVSQSLCFFINLDYPVCGQYSESTARRKRFSKGLFIFFDVFFSCPASFAISATFVPSILIFQLYTCPARARTYVGGNKSIHISFVLSDHDT